MGHETGSPSRRTGGTMEQNPIIPLNPNKTPAVAGWNREDYVPRRLAADEWTGRRADGLVIIDCDSKEAGLAWLETTGDLPTLVVSTPHGHHYYYRWAPGAPTGPAVRVLPDTDVRAGIGSYVVTPPSPGYTVLYDAPMAAFDPSWLPQREDKTTGSGDGWSTIPEGQRNDTLAALAGTLRAKGMDAEELGKVLFALNKSYCQPPLDTNEVLAIAKSIGRYEPEQETTIVVEGGEEEAQHTVTGMWGHELRSFTPPPLEWIVEGMIPEGLTILAGKPKVGKSWMSLGLAVAVAEGGEYLDRPVPQGKALYLAMEDTLSRIKRRLQAMEGQAMPDWMRVETEWARCPEGTQAIANWLMSHPECKLVVVDTLAKVRHDADDRQRGTYQDDYQALGGLKKVADHFHVAVVVVHHLRKGAADDPLDEVSGTTGLAGAADTILVLKKETLEGRGRDLEEDLAYDVTFDRDKCKWRLLGDAEWNLDLDLGWWVGNHYKPGEMIRAEEVRALGIVPNSRFEAEWAALHSLPGFTSVRNDPAGPLMVTRELNA